MMCTKDRKIGSKSVCSRILFNRSKSKLSIKKLRVTLLQQILSVSHVDLMTEINVCKKIRQKIYVVFNDMNCSKCSNL